MIKEYIEQIKSKKTTTESAVKVFVDRCKADTKGAILEVFDSWVQQAKAVDAKIAKGLPVGRLAGVPIILKDNIMFKGHRAGASSKIMDGFIAPYTATFVEKLIAEDAIIIARADMDEFAMGGVGRYAYNGPTKNAHSDQHHAGGSSSGSAVSVALDYCLAALGSDTAGSVRYPAALNGIVGVKPTYGSVSRYGAVAFGSNLEQIGVFTKSVPDNQLVLDVISGKCPFDATSFAPIVGAVPHRPLSELRIGKIKELWEAFADSPFLGHYEDILNKLRDSGAKIVDISIPDIVKSINCYYALAPTQAASNLSRFDGVRFGTMTDSENLNELYHKTRTVGFGTEVKRRVLLGNLMLSTKTDRPSNVKQRIADGHTAAFKKCDVLIIPTGAGVAPQIGVPISPIDDYLVDLFTVPANLSGSPAVSIPCGVDTNSGLPLGIQIVADVWNETLMYDVAAKLQEVIK